MAETGKLGISDSLLANVQLAFAAADPTPPAIATQNGWLGGALGDTILALAGAQGPLTFNVSAESALALAQTADPAPTIAPHPSPDWVLGGHDSQLGGLVPASDGEPAALPTPTTQTGLLGTALGDAVLGLDGADGPRVFNLSAASTLAIAQTADPAPAIAPHASQRWVLGGQDSCLGGIELAYAGLPEPRPLTGSLTGKLGTADSFLGCVRLALAEQEGEGTAASIYADAESELSLTVQAVAAIARPAAASSALSLTVAAGRNNLLSTVAESVLDLATEAGRNNLLDASALSTISPDAAANFTVARAAAAESQIALSDEAGRNNLLAAVAESTLTTSTTAGFAVAQAVAAENTLELTDAAASTGRTIYTVSAESATDLTDTAGFTVARAASASDSLSLTDQAGRNNLLAASAVSTIELASGAGRNDLPNVAAESAISFTTEAARNSFPAASAESVLGLAVVAWHMQMLEVSAESAISLTGAAGRNSFPEAAAPSELALTDDATCIHVVGHRGDSYDWLWLYDWATATVVRKLSARSKIALSHAEHTARPWYLSAATPLQTVTQQYDQATDTFRPVYEGLRDSASTARPLTEAAHQSIPLAQSASAVVVKPTAIAVSAENVLELLGEVRLSPNPSAGDRMTLRQTAAAEKCKVVRSKLDLAQDAAIIVSVPRGAASALGLNQAATFYKVFPGVLYQYHPFVGEGAAGSPTPPPVTIEAG